MERGCPVMTVRMHYVQDDPRMPKPRKGKYGYRMAERTKVKCQVPSRTIMGGQEMSRANNGSPGQTKKTNCL